MSNSNELVQLFFKELKQYNSTNFRTIEKCNLSKPCDAKVFKSFSSVVTRFFIFRERHPEVQDSWMNMMYYKLRIDLIAKYFTEYPGGDVTSLRIFQKELLSYAKREREFGSESNINTIPDDVNVAI